MIGIAYLVGDRYQRAELTEGRLLVPSIELSLGIWQGSYETLNRSWLRWMTLEGELIPNAEEQVVAAQERADKLAQRLRELGIDPNEID